MSDHNGLLSTLVGGIDMDRWLENWIDEWEEGYDELEATKNEVENRAKRPSMLHRILSAVGVAGTSSLDEGGEALQSV